LSLRGGRPTNSGGVSWMILKKMSSIIGEEEERDAGREKGHFRKIALRIRGG